MSCGNNKALSQKNIEGISIKTSAQCGMCQKTLEDNIIYEKGIRAVSLDLDTQILTVRYDKRKTNADKIIAAINKLGYDANGSPANAEVYKNLPDCCKKEE
ncbi:MAG: heavy-metal-associated domain-containing protein [Bacteroidetes bacterium]|nr:heavy-metal-associated domain-containing protein [Bacteroidota bacterium]MCB9043042.1 heavy-metal-associated domain-containing protein [Chitinophagales bacterium]